jgi:DNA-binding NtrC family response regulator
MVVDDEQPICELLTKWLTKWGYTVTSASSADLAVEMMSAAPVDILLCDIKMPGHDGLWLAEYVRDHWPRTTIIMVSGFDDKELLLQSHRLGAVDYMLKPFAPGMMKQALDRASGRVEFRSSVVRGS